MTTKSALIGATILIIAVGAWLIFAPPTQPRGEITNFEECAAQGYPILESYPEQCKTPDGRTFTRDIGNELELTDLIQVTNPRPGQTIASPLTVEGKARGTWYFEASFPAELYDATGKLLAQVPAQAQGDWMTEEFVPFRAVLVFAEPATETGTLVLKKDNPSGLPENEKQLTMPVRFAPADTAEGKAASFGTPAVFAVGEQLKFPDGLKVVLGEINDSRCAPDVVCVWQGELSARLIVTGGTLDATQEVRVGTQLHTIEPVGQYTITLKAATTSQITVTVEKGTSAKSATVSGYVHVGPTCPVVQNPPQEECNDKPYAVTIEIHKTNEQLYQTIRSGQDGKFTAALPAGTYIFRPIVANVLPACNEERVQAIANQTVQVDIACDSGIR